MSSAKAANKRYQQGRLTGIKGWFFAHLRCLQDAAKHLKKHWLTSILTTFVIGITLALPTGLFVMVKNLNTLTYSWQTSVQVSAYLSDHVDKDEALALADKIRGYKYVDQVIYISPEQGLAHFKKDTGLGPALDALADNPLPPVLAVTPKHKAHQYQIKNLVKKLSQLNNVDRAELDQAWLERLHAIISLFSRAAWVIGLLLAAAVIFIVGNTIRLDIENRREEIEVMKLIGANNAFIRRPFLYTGICYGLSGAVIALILLFICSLALAGPLTSLLSSYSYNSDFMGLSFGQGLWLLVLGTALGWIGCATTVNRRLHAIEPK